MFVFVTKKDLNTAKTLIGLIMQWNHVNDRLNETYRKWNECIESKHNQWYEETRGYDKLAESYLSRMRTIREQVEGIMEGLK